MCIRIPGVYDIQFLLHRASACFWEERSDSPVGSVSCSSVNVAGYSSMKTVNLSTVIITYFTARIRDEAACSQQVQGAITIHTSRANLHHVTHIMQNLPQTPLSFDGVMAPCMCICLSIMKA